MNFTKSTRRRRIELVGLEFISAVNKADIVRNRSIIELYLMTFADAPWTISGLSSASHIDRAVIRDHINRGVNTGEFEASESGFVLTDKGWRTSMGRVRQWMRHIHRDVRRFLYRFFKRTGGANPLRSLFMFILSLDRLARLVKLEYSYIAGLKVIEWEGAPEGVMIKDAAERTGFSYSVMHKQFSKMAEQNYIKKGTGGFAITAGGKRHSFGIFLFSCRAVSMKEWLVVLRMMTARH